MSVQFGPEKRQKEVSECLDYLLTGKDEEHVLKYLDVAKVVDEAQPGIIFQYGITGFGFGEFTISSRGGKIKLDNEYVSRETFLAIMGAFFDLYACDTPRDTCQDIRSDNGNEL